MWCLYGLKTTRHFVALIDFADSKRKKSPPALTDGLSAWLCVVMVVVCKFWDGRLPIFCLNREKTHEALETSQPVNGKYWGPNFRRVLDSHSFRNTKQPTNDPKWVWTCRKQSIMCRGQSKSSEPEDRRSHRPKLISQRRKKAHQR